MSQLAGCLNDAGYQPKESKNLWGRAGSDSAFSYSDGSEVENRMLQILTLAEDLSSDSAELAAHITDWPTEYHFNCRRANLLRPVANLLQGRVLEIGAGCGAISRFVGECGAEVLALEGSLLRARVAAERCRDLTNVNVVCDRFDQFETALKFDAVLLIGVLEYARIFAPHDQSDPVQWMLNAAARFLAPGGHLIVAIENKLGLKYFSGCSEDHIGIPYYGVEGLYGDKEAVTFGRKELAGRFLAAGLPKQKLLLPFPDYKIPDVLLDADACNVPAFDVAAFLGLSTGRDYSGAMRVSFSQALGWQALADNRIVPDLANSFLFVCAADEVTNDVGLLDSEGVLAWSYSSDRQRALAVDTRICLDNGGVVVRKMKRYPSESPASGGAEWSQKIDDTSQYVAGERLDVVLLRLASGADREAFFRRAGSWLAILLQKATLGRGGEASCIADWFCHGDAVDLIPRNMVCAPDGVLHVFDQEWVAQRPIPLSWLIVRGVLSFATLVVNGSWVREISVLDLVRELAQSVGLRFSEEDAKEAQRHDAEFLRWVRGSEQARVWDLGLLNKPIGSFGGTLVAPFPDKNIQNADGVSSELLARLDSERISHAKAIGAYRAAREGSRSVSAALVDAHAYAAKLQERYDHVSAQLASLQATVEQERRDANALRIQAEAQSHAELESLHARLEDERLQHSRLIGAFHTLQESQQSLVVDRETTSSQLAELIGCHEALNLAHQSCVEELNARSAELIASHDRERQQSEKILTLTANHTELIERCRAADQELQCLQTALQASQEEVSRLGEALADKECIIEGMGGDIVALNDMTEQQRGQIREAAQDNAVLSERIRTLEMVVEEAQRQRALMNAEILRLNQERSTVGARIGRGITGLRGKLAPMGTRRGRAVTLIGRFVTSLAKEGISAAIVRSQRFAAFKIQAWRASRVLHERSGGGGKAEQRPVRSDHPQLSAWIAANEPDEAALNMQRLTSKSFAYKPLISVILPVYKVPRDVLDETLASLEAQTYTTWQACIVWADTEDTDGWQYLSRRVEGDSRFAIRLLEENSGISGNSNAALEMVEGEFVALLDHDDTLTPWAFYDVVQRLQQTPDLDFIYSDKDGITADGSMRLNALFKPAWSPEMLHSVNYLTHLNVMRASMLREIGGWRKETDGAQDWDLFFRITERTRKIARLASIHYHWRILPTSTATGLQAKPYAAQGQLRAQQDHFLRRGLPASVVPSPEGMFHVRWPSQPASVEMVVVQRGTHAQLVNVLDVVRAGATSSLSCIHVYLTEPTSPALEAFKGVWGDRINFVLIPRADWFSVLTHALTLIQTKTLVLVDGTATGLSETLINELSGWVEHHPEIAWATALAINPDGTVYEAGRVLAENATSAPLFAGSSLYSFGWFGGPLWYRNVRACSPYALAVSVEKLPAALAAVSSNADDPTVFTRLCEALCGEGARGLVNPFARVYFSEAPESGWNNDARLYAEDPYFNPSFVGVSPLQLHQ